MDLEAGSGVQRKAGADADKPMRFLAIKAAVFILVPLLTAAVAAMVMLK